MKFTGDQEADRKMWIEHVEKKQARNNVEPWKDGQVLTSGHGYDWVYSSVPCSAPGHVIVAPVSPPGPFRAMPRDMFHGVDSLYDT